MDTTALVVQAQGGDEGAFASLAVLVGNRLHAIAHRILRDADLADDATQQALLAVWEDLPQLRDPARFERWSYSILVRACYEEGKKTRRWAPNLRVLPIAEVGLFGIRRRDTGRLHRVVSHARRARQVDPAVEFRQPGPSPITILNHFIV